MGATLHVLREVLRRAGGPVRTHTTPKNPIDDVRPETLDGAWTSNGN
jgi:hypothetical protein